MEEKVLKVIKSCINKKQLESAKNYAKLFVNKFGKSTRIEVLLFEKTMELEHGRSN
jgi:hypothetical protein